MAEFSDFGPDIRRLLSCIAAPSLWRIHALSPPLETFVRGRVALLGDAAHAMLPHLGAGVGQGIEDVYVLVRLLSHPQTSLSNVDHVLRAYDAVRRERANAVHEASTRAGEIYDRLGPSGDSKEGMDADISGLLYWIWDHDCKVDVESAIQHLKSGRVFH